MATDRPVVRADLLGGDPLGAGDEHALSWELPPGAGRQRAFQVRTASGYDSGRTESDQQLWVRLPGEAAGETTARVRVWTDLGASEWSAPVRLDSDLPPADGWQHDWIGVAESPHPQKDHRPAYWLRGELDLSAEASPPPAARVHVTALGIYELFLNGRRVGDVELAPGYTQYAARVPAQTYDVTDLLVPGRNVCAALLADGWYRGQVGLPRAADQFGTELSLRLQVEVHDPEGWRAVAGSDDSWCAAVSHVTRADLIGGQSEDRRLVEPALHTAAFDLSGWSRVLRRGVDVAVVRPVGPPIRRVAEIRPVAVTRTRDGAQVVDLGQNINGWVRLAELGPEGTELTLRYGEHLDRDGDLTTTHLDIDLPILPDPLPLGQVDSVVSAGVPGDVFEPRLTTHGFRYVRIEGHPRELTVDDVVGIVVHSDLRRTGTFECSDARIDALHEAAVWSLRGNVCGIPTDCPQRERAGWTGDWQVFAPTAAFLYDVLAFTRSWLRDVALDQRDDGCVPNMSPLPPGEGFDGPIGHLNGSAGWGDVVVSAPWHLYEAYGDASILVECWPAMTAWVDYAARAAARGRHPDRVARRPEPADHEQFLWDTGFHWGEWMEPGVEIVDFGAFVAEDKSEVATAYLHRSARTVAAVARILGKDRASVAGYDRLADGARRAWQAEFLRPDGTIAVRSEAAHVRALTFDLVPDDDRAGVADALADLVRQAGDHLTTGFLSTGLLLPALADHGHLDTAYRLLRQDTEPSWLTMIDRGATTLWEQWNGIDAHGEARDSLNHYSKGAVVSFLHQHVAGLRMTSPGYRTFRVEPRPGGGLSSAGATHRSPYGLITTGWVVTEGRFEVSVAVPPGTSARVVLPDGTAHEVGPGEHCFGCRA